MVRHPPRYKRTDTRFPTRRSCDLKGANMMTDPTMEALAAQLEASGDYRVLRRLPVPAGGFVPMPHMKRAVFLDVETTGLDPNVDDIIELAMVPRSEEHTSELQSLMRNSYSVFCLKKKRPHK